MTEFAGPFDSVNAASLEQETLEALEDRFDGWAPPEGALATWLIKAFSRIGSQIYDQSTVLLNGAFQRFGEQVAGVPPIQAAPATVSSVWTLTDEDGHEAIPAGTEVSIPVNADLSLGFRTTEDVEVPAGQPTVEVPLEAIEPGTESNGLTETGNLIDALSFVVDPGGIELTGATGGGVDEEDEDAYLNRLVETLRLLSLSLIVGRDFETDARGVPAVARAKCVEAWNAEKDEAEALCVSVYPVEADGTTCTIGTKEELQERQQAKAPSGVLVFVDDPTYSTVKVKVQFVTATGFDPTAVKASVTAALSAYLSPSTWGIPTQGDPSSSGGWENRLHVYRFELVQEIANVSGVDRVSLLELAKGAGALGTADVTLDGTVALPQAGVLTVESV